MGKGFKKRKGVKIQHNESALEKIQSSVPHWIHKTVKDDSFVSGVRYLRECTCSECGYEANLEHRVCPHCGADMNQL